MNDAQGPAVAAAIIHHRSPDRVLLRQQLIQFCNDLQVPVSEVVEQPSLVPCRSVVLARLYLASRECLKIVCAAAYLRAARCQCWPAVFVVVFKQLIQCLRRLCLASRAEVNADYGRSQIEVILSTKHLEAWTRVQAKGSPWALVFEDDAELAPDSEARFRRLMDQGCVAGGLEHTAYVDLAGGFAPALVLPLKHACSASDEWWVFRGVITNTTCSYLASRPMVAAWVKTLRRFPVLLQLPADHMINFISLPLVSGLRDVVSVHFQRPLFGHGSFHGSTPSMISMSSR